MNIRFNYKDSLLKHFYLTVLSLFLIITGCSKPGTTHKVGKVAYTTENTTTTSNNNFSTQNNCNNNLTQTSEITETEITTKGEIEVMGDIYIEPEAVLIHPDSVHTIVDTQPSPVKGMDAYYAEVKKMLKYPKGTDNIQGEVFVSFVVEKDGTVSDIKIAKGLHPLFDEEAIRVIKTHPYLWYSGYIDEEAVRAQMTIPIKFYQ